MSKSNEYTFQQISTTKEGRSKVSILIQTSDSNPMAKLTDTMEEVSIELEDEIARSSSESRPLTIDSALTINYSNLKLLLSHTSFGSDLFSDEAVKRSNPLKTILGFLNNIAHCDILAHIAKNLILCDDEIPMVIKWLLSHVFDDGSTLRSFASNNTKIESFIWKGLNEEIIKREFSYISTRDLEVYFDCGLMRDSINVEGASIILICYSLADLKKFISNLGMALRNSDEDSSLETMLNLTKSIFKPKVVRFHTMRVFFSMLRSFAFREVSHFLSLEPVKAFVNNITRDKWHSFLDDFMDAISTRTDLLSDQKSSIYRIFITLYPFHMAREIFVLIRGHVSNLSYLTKKNEITRLINSIKGRDDLTYRERAHLLEVIVLVYPFGQIESLFLGIGNYLLNAKTNPMDAGYTGSRVLEDLVSTLFRREDLSLDNKIDIVALISKYYDVTLIGDLIKSSKYHLEELDGISEILTVITINVFSRNKITIEQKRSICQEVRNSYGDEIMDKINISVEAFVDA